MSDIFMSDFFRYAETDLPAAVDPELGETSYRALADWSGRVQAFLERKGVGRGDVVVVRMPRDARVLAAMIGVLRAGAAFSVVDEHDAPERVDFIRQDSGSRLLIDRELWSEIESEDPAPAESRVRMDEHDLAMVVYTSGSTGKPKGVVHEFGNVYTILMSYEYPGGYLIHEGDRFALLTHLGFMVTLISEFCALAHGAALHILPSAMVRRPVEVQDYFTRRHIDVAVTVPSFLRMLGGTKLGVRFLCVAGEPAVGICSDDYLLLNGYGSSEAACMAALFRLDRPYDLVPIGKPHYLDYEVRNLDEKTGVGELFLRLPYTRGYLNRPAETAAKFHDGWFATGDLVRTREDGVMVLLGRADDMFKVNGNRVEPAEIEAAARELLGLGWAAAKAFETDEGHTVICLFYTAEEDLDEAEACETLARRLSYYMIPSRFARLPEPPRLPNGKLDRKALRLPEAHAQSAYAAPASDEEAALCDVFARVLHQERFGAEDDFYLLGGDSLRTAEAMDLCSLPGLSMDDILRGRTPRRIARLYVQRAAGESGDAERRNAEEMRRPHPITVEQQYMLDYQRSTPGKAPYDLCGLLRLSERRDLRRLSAALSAALAAHPSFLTVIAPGEDGGLWQSWRPELAEEIPVEELSEAELTRRKETLVRPLPIIGGLPCVFRLFRTEEADYLFYQAHHAILDGTSVSILIKDTLRAWNGESLSPDGYYLYLRERELERESPFYAESREYWQRRCDGVQWRIRPPEDDPGGENRLGHLGNCAFSLAPERVEALRRRHNLGRNGLLSAALALTIAAGSGAADVMVTWPFNGRRNVRDTHTTGLFFRSIPLALRLKRETPFAELCREVREQLVQGVTYSCYPYAKLGARPVEDDKTMVLFQEGVSDPESPAGLRAGGVTLTSVELPNPYAVSYAALDLSVLCDGPEANLSVEYNAGRYREESILRFRTMFLTAVETILSRAEDDSLCVGDLLDRIAGA